MERPSRWELSRKTAQEIAAEYGVHPTTVSRWRKEAGVSKVRERIIRKREKSDEKLQVNGPQYLRDLWKLSPEAVATKYQVSVKKVNEDREFFGVDATGEYGAEEVLVKLALTRSQINDLHYLTYRELRDKYGWHPATIAKLKRIVGASNAIFLKGCTGGLNTRVVGVQERNEAYWAKKHDSRKK